MPFMLLFGVICNIYKVFPELPITSHRVTCFLGLRCGTRTGWHLTAPSSNVLMTERLATHAHTGTHGSPPTVLLCLCSVLSKATQCAHGLGTITERVSKPCLPSYRGDGVHYNNAIFILIIAMAPRYSHLTGRLCTLAPSMPHGTNGVRACGGKDTHTELHQLNL